MLEHLSLPPEVQPISLIRIPEVINYASTHDIPVYEVRQKDTAIVLIELVFKAGRPYEKQKLAAAACASLMRQGAGQYSSEVLSEEIDFLGATLSIKASMDYISIKAVCMKKQLERFLELIGAIIRDPHFDEKELDLYRERSIARLQQQLAKPDIRSYRAITEAMYGHDHPYGYNSSEEYYNLINVDHLKSHHRDFIHAENCQVFVAGDIEDADHHMIDRLCAMIPVSDVKTDQLIDVSKADMKPVSIRLKGGSHQASIRIGRKAVTRLHEDFYGLNYLCNLLGGFQGSRLVSELRENKGLTYGIYSMLDVMAHDADMMISTEVALEKLDDSLETIYHEMDKLTEELVGPEEIHRVNNYILGNYLNLFDGSFNSIRGIKSLVLAGFPLDMLDSLIESSVGFNADYIRQMATKYFKRNDFWEVIVGTPD